MRRLALPALLLLGACQHTDDYARPGTWSPSGANEANLQAMLADPAHAVRGVGALDSRGDAGAAAITRLRRDRARPLPVTNRSPIATGPAGAAAETPPTPQGGPNAR